MRAEGASHQGGCPVQPAACVIYAGYERVLMVGRYRVSLRKYAVAMPCYNRVHTR